MTDQPTGHPEKTNPLDPEVDIAETTNAIIEPDLTEPDESVHPSLDVEGAELEEPDGKDAP